jgi:ribosome maturation factor RimP
MYRQNEVLVKLLGPVVQAMGYEMLGIEQFSKGRDSVLRIYIDHADGIGIDDCERVSKQVTGVLDVNDPIKGAYHLEVSSPGLDRPLFTDEQFSRFIGERIQVQLREKLDGRRNFKGKLTAVDDAGIHIKIDGEEYEITADKIDKAHLVPFD